MMSSTSSELLAIRSQRVIAQALTDEPFWLGPTNAFCPDDDDWPLQLMGDPGTNGAG
jgi:hypothetical protein